MKRDLFHRQALPLRTARYGASNPGRRHSQRLLRQSRQTAPRLWSLALPGQNWPPGAKQRPCR